MIIQTRRLYKQPKKSNTLNKKVCSKSCIPHQVLMSAKRKTPDRHHPTLFPSFLGARINLALALLSLIKSVICCLLVAPRVQAWFATDVLPGFRANPPPSPSTLISSYYPPKNSLYVEILFGNQSSMRWNNWFSCAAEKMHRQACNVCSVNTVHPKNSAWQCRYSS